MQKIKHIAFILLASSISTVSFSSTLTKQETKNIATIKHMYRDVLVKHNVDNMRRYFSPTAQIYNNNFKTTVENDIKIHHKIYKEIPELVYHFQDVIASNNKVIIRYWFGSKIKGKITKDYRSIVIFQLKNNKINHMWEVFIPYKAFMTPIATTDLTALPGKV